MKKTYRDDLISTVGISMTNGLLHRIDRCSELKHLNRSAFVRVVLTAACNLIEKEQNDIANGRISAPERGDR